MMEDNNRVMARNVTMYPVQWATVDAFAKDGGYPSTSAALRRIVDEWLEAQAPVAEVEPMHNDARRTNERIRSRVMRR
jgi:hypothetical protein